MENTNQNTNAATKLTLCQEISRLQAEVNELALRLCASNSSDVNYIWSNLANARAYLSTALEAAQSLKNKNLEELSANSQFSAINYSI